jgi:hypothetical protein
MFAKTCIYGRSYNSIKFIWTMEYRERRLSTKYFDLHKEEKSSYK